MLADCNATSTMGSICGASPSITLVIPVIYTHIKVSLFVGNMKM